MHETIFRCFIGSSGLTSGLLIDTFVTNIGFGFITNVSSVDFYFNIVGLLILSSLIGLGPFYTN